MSKLRVLPRVARLIWGNDFIACSLGFAQSPLLGLNNSQLPGAVKLRTVTPDLDCSHISDFTAKSGLFSCISAIFDLPFRATKSVETLTHFNERTGR